MTDERPSESEYALWSWNVPYEKLEGGTLFVDGDLDVSFKNIRHLPDFSNVIVKGDFNCTGNQLSSLEGSPMVVGGFFRCAVNKLTTLKGATQKVGRGFFCQNNLLETLEGAPQGVNEYFVCLLNPTLSNLHYAPRKFITLYCDFGEFNSWHEIPYHLRYDLKKVKEEIATIAHGTAKTLIKKPKRFEL